MAEVISSSDRVGAGNRAKVSEAPAHYTPAVSANVDQSVKFVFLRDHMAVAKGKAPILMPYDGPDALAYLSPDYLRGTTVAVRAKAGRDAVVVSDGDAVLLWDGSNAGEFFHGKRGMAASTMARIVPSGDFELSYFVYALKHLEPELKSKTNGTGIPHVDREVLESCRVYRPRAEAQRAIARVLDTLDTAIHQTEAIIAKLKQVKQGLLHDLLTRGIDANGELRPPQSQAPHLYKPSPLGWIPKEWGVRGVLDVAPKDRQCILTGPFGAELGTSDFQADGIPVLRIGNVQAGFIDWTDIQFVSPLKAGLLSKYRIEHGDLLFARQGATTGRNALAGPVEDGALINYHIIRVAVDRQQCHPTYLYTVFNSAQVKAQVDQDKGRGTREGINSAQIAALSFALPTPAEQKELVLRITWMDGRIEAEDTQLGKLRLEKSGLMDDLLTGRVRVTPLLEAAAAP